MLLKIHECVGRKLPGVFRKHIPLRVLLRFITVIKTNKSQLEYRKKKGDHPHGVRHALMKIFANNLELRSNLS